MVKLSALTNQGTEKIRNFHNYHSERKTPDHLLQF